MIDLRNCELFFVSHTFCTFSWVKGKSRESRSTYPALGFLLCFCLLLDFPFSLIRCGTRAFFPRRITKLQSLNVVLSWALAAVTGCVFRWSLMLGLVPSYVNSFLPLLQVSVSCPIHPQWKQSCTPLYWIFRMWLPILMQGSRCLLALIWMHIRSNLPLTDCAVRALIHKTVPSSQPTSWRIFWS